MPANNASPTPFEPENPDAFAFEPALPDTPFDQNDDFDELFDDDGFSDNDETVVLEEVEFHAADGALKLDNNAETRAKGPDRRKNVVDSRETGLERRRGPGRRLSDFVKAAEEGEMNAEQFLFLRAVEAFKTANNKHYPSWTDVLEVVRLLGYRKTCESEIRLDGVTDWNEKADAPANVRTREGIRHNRRKAA